MMQHAKTLWILTVVINAKMENKKLCTEHAIKVVTAKNVSTASSI